MYGVQRECELLGCFRLPRFRFWLLGFRVGWDVRGVGFGGYGGLGLMAFRDFGC